MKIAITDGNNNLVQGTKTVSRNTLQQLTGVYAPDGSRYVTLTDGNGNRI